jgi:hypothetical protein
MKPTTAFHLCGRYGDAALASELDTARIVVDEVFAGEYAVAWRWPGRGEYDNLPKAQDYEDNTTLLDMMTVQPPDP